MGKNPGNSESDTSHVVARQKVFRSVFLVRGLGIIRESNLFKQHIHEDAENDACEGT